MRAVTGDRLHFQGKVVGVHDHTAVILETRGADGSPPYRVRHDNGREAVVFPGPTPGLSTPGSSRSTEEH